MRPLLLPILLLFLPVVAATQDEGPRSLVVMNLAAHPDDEDGNTLAYYHYNRNAEVYSVIFTRGEGGQNEIGPDLYERLGAIRTRETEAAARILGTKVFFLNFYDFGYSKSAEETFAEWSRDRRGFWDAAEPVRGVEAGRDSVVSRLVYLIRKLKPDVIFTNHDTTATGPATQHGHHQAVAIAAFQAFERAADPAYHPQQLREEGVDLWQPRRLFIRRFQPGKADVSVPVGDPCRPSEACTDIAVRAAGQHLSQGFDRFAPRFRTDTTYFRLLRSTEESSAIPRGARDLAAGLALANGERERMANAPASESLRWGAAESVPTIAVPGQNVEIRWSPPSPAGMADDSSLRIVGFGDTLLLGGTSGPTLLTVPASAGPTYPLHRFQYDRFGSSQPYRIVADGAAHGALDLHIAPPVVIDLDPAPVLLSEGDNVIPVEVSVFDPAAESVELRIEAFSEHAPMNRILRDSIVLPAGDTTLAIRFTLPTDVTPGRYRLEVHAEATPTTAPADPFLESRPAAVLPDVRVTSGLRVGFVRSYDGVTENALRSMGAAVTVLDSLDLADGDLNRFDTIVLDIRAYLVRPDLRAHNDRLLDWVRQGGHLVVGYHKTFEWNAGQEGGFFDMDLVDVPDTGWAPYFLRLGRDRVTREDAPVRILEPEHPLFNRPHGISPADWEGWVQERGLYFPSEYDPRFQELVATSDPGEDALRGGILLAKYGEGTYLYSSLVFYRQLEALNVGAGRLFANLVSLPKTGRP